MNSLELVRSGEIISHSGKLLVIDPCYLKDFDTNLVGVLYDSELSEGMDAWIEQAQGVITRLERKMPVDKKEIAGLLQAQASRSQQKKERISFTPPYLAQGKNYVIFNNKVGDGEYPIVATQRRIYIIHNVPLKNSEGKAQIDLERLPGKLLGLSSVDSGLQIIIDAEHATPKERIVPQCYCYLDCSPAKYECRFLADGLTMSLRKK